MIGGVEASQLSVGMTVVMLIRNDTEKMAEGDGRRRDGRIGCEGFTDPMRPTC